MENPIKMDDLGGNTIFGNPHMCKTMYIIIMNYSFFPPIQHVSVVDGQTTVGGRLCIYSRTCFEVFIYGMIPKLSSSLLIEFFSNH